MNSFPEWITSSSPTSLSSPGESNLPPSIYLQLQWCHEEWNLGWESSRIDHARRHLTSLHHSSCFCHCHPHAADLRPLQNCLLPCTLHPNFLHTHSPLWNIDNKLCGTTNLQSLGKMESNLELRKTRKTTHSMRLTLGKTKMVKARSPSHQENQVGQGQGVTSLKTFSDGTRRPLRQYKWVLAQKNHIHAYHLQDHVHAIVKKKLDTEKSYQYQSSDNIQTICKMASNSYPILKDYKNFWPVLDMLKLHLKYTSQSNRRIQLAGKQVRVSVTDSIIGHELTYTGPNLKESWGLGC